ncbi:MAG: carbohydrate-binding protein, partial [Lentisphaeria bacterium]|nr:carbohydrate-binding protein [Lentisphaeria bacterium]
AVHAGIIHVEAEQWDRIGGGTVRVLERDIASGGKTVSYWEKPGVWLEYVVNVPRADNYLLSLGYALHWADTVRRITIDGKPVGDVLLPTTGSWNDFAGRTLDTLHIPALTAGRHTIRFTNVDSRGLSLDWFSLHTTDEFPFDRDLTEAEHTAFVKALFADTASSSKGVWRKGGVCANMSHTPISRLELGGYTLTAPTMPVSRTNTAQTENLMMLINHAKKRLTLWLTDGKTLWIIVVSRDNAPVDLPVPVLQGHRRLVTAVADGPQSINLTNAELPTAKTKHAVVGGLHITASPGLQVVPGTNRGDLTLGALRLGLQTWGKLRIGTARYSPRWGQDAPRVGLKCKKDSCLIQETQHRFPTLARFYGETMFDAHISPSGNLLIIDLLSDQTMRIHCNGE